jgi:hypothetical protein
MGKDELIELNACEQDEPVELQVPEVCPDALR